MKKYLILGFQFVLSITFLACSSEESDAPQSSFFVGTTPEGIFQSQDFGASWQNRNTGIPENVRLVKAIIPWDNALLLVSFGGGIFRSEDGGQSWFAQNQGLTGDALSAYALAVIDNQLFIATLAGVFYSDNDGASWVSRSQGLSGDALAVRTIYADGNTLWAGTFAGIYQSGDLGQSWTVSDASLLGKAFLRHQSKLWFVSFDQGVFALDETTQGWQAQNQGLNSSTDLQGLSIFGNQNKLYYGAMNGLYCATDQGNWTRKNFNGTGLSQEVHGITQFEQYLVVGTGNGLFFSEDEGQSWTSKSTGLPENTPIVSFLLE
ncbi:MAG: hypothetical protein NW226_14200 [Microscillaceae bacterium]|nr:hypothetical protein [Microscillaceae bacterium]